MAGDIAKIVVSAGVALVVGLAVGGLGPRSEVRALRARLDAVQEVDCGPNRLPAELAGVLQGRPWDDTRTPRPSPRSDAPDVPEAPEAAPVAPIDRAEPALVMEGEDGEPVAPEDFSEGLDMAREAMQVRSRQAWRALEEQANPTPEQKVVIEQAVASMNDELVAVAQALVDSVASGQEPQRRDMMVFAADALETMISTEDAIFDTLTPEQREGLDAEVLDPSSYVDASVVDVLEAIERF